MILRLTETANARDTSIAIWSMYLMVRDNIKAAVTYDQLHNCEVMINKLILDRYKHMPNCARIAAKPLRKMIQVKERALFFDNINTEI